MRLHSDTTAFAPAVKPLGRRSTTGNRLDRIGRRNSVRRMSRDEGQSPAELVAAVAAAARPLRTKCGDGTMLWRSWGAGPTLVRTLKKAGIISERKGGYLFRHTLATEMLGRGASLQAIGEVLRHRKADTTRIYAKVDFRALRNLAQPWPGGAR